MKTKEVKEIVRLIKKLIQAQISEAYDRGYADGATGREKAESESINKK